MSFVLLLGSAPDVISCRTWPRAPFDTIVTINNAWAVRPDWDVLVYPEDFPLARRPSDPGPHQRLIGADCFVPAQNAYGGFVYAGGTMAFTAAYWALQALKPDVIACFGCDMIYAAAAPTHFYGTGIADPLRADVTLRSLEAKSTRLMALAALQGCAMVNLSDGPSRLVFPRATHATVATARPAPFEATAIAAVRRAEDDLGYMVPSGRYWESPDRFDPAAIDTLDAMWLAGLPRGIRADRRP